MAAGDVNARLTKVRAFNGNKFDAVDDYIEVAHDNRQLGVNLSNGFTVSAWINARSVGEGGFSSGIFDKSTTFPGVAGFMLYKANINSVSFIINNGSARTSGTTLVAGTWYHVLVTISSAQLVNFYINGAASGSANQDLVQPISAITATGALEIGACTSSRVRTFDGSIRDVKMWNRVLTAAEIAEDYAGTTPMTGLIHRFNLGGDYADYGAVGVTATNSGSVPAVVDDALAAAVKAQRVASTDKWMIYRGQGGQVGTVNIE